MPTKHVIAEVMTQPGGKHWTKKEIEARKKAEEGAKRKKAKSINPPVWLDKEALAIWKRVVASAKDMELLDNLDTELLATYCMASAKIKEMRNVDDIDGIKALQAWVRIQTQCADKLGFTPAARARLVKKKADKELDSFGKKFD